MIEINLLPGAQKKSRKGPRRAAAGPSLLSRIKLPEGGDRITMFTAASVVLSVLLVGFLWWSSSNRQRELEVAIEGAVRDSARYAALREANEELVARQDTIAQKVQIIQEIDAGRFVWAHLLEEIGRAVPSYTWLTAVRAQPSASPSSMQPVLEIDGSAGNTLALTRFIQDLEASPFLRAVTLQTTTQAQQDGRKYYTFQLRASWEEPPVEAIRTAPLFARTDSILQGD
ncbi:MAG TPA: PilN domain-containing protein [Longimicrobiales bacterium]|nr:PilN domain-containing protein [Longimicrobiales bacterium]